MADASMMEKQADETIEKAKRAVERTKKRDVKGAVESAVEVHQTAATPIYLGLTGGSILFSLVLYWLKKREEAIFVGLWAPTFMGLGLLSKIADLKKQE